MEKCTEEHIFKQVDSSLLVAFSSNLIDASQALTKLKQFEINLLNEKIPFDELIEQGRPGNQEVSGIQWLAKVLGRCHGVAHTEKYEAYYLFKQFKQARRSSPFGLESLPLTNLTPLLNDLPFNKMSKQSYFGKAVKKAFSIAVADTRQPLNDVTLWDWSNIVAALYKAALAQALLLDEKKDPSLIKWRLFSIRFDGINFLAKANRIPDLLARRNLLVNGLDEVRELLEIKYPLGLEIYRDENGSVFIVPDIDKLTELKNSDGKELSTLILEKFGHATIRGRESLELEGEILPSLVLDENGWEWQKNVVGHDAPMPIADHLNIHLAAHGDVSRIRSWWQISGRDVCPVCQLRPEGWEAPNSQHHRTRKTDNQKLCYVCEQRRRGRAKQWALRERETTVWIDEVSDIHGRLALIVGNFSLQKWFNGQMLFYPKHREDKNGPLYAIVKVEQLKDFLKNEQEVKIKDKKYKWDESIDALISQEPVGRQQLPSTFKKKTLQIKDIKGEVSVKKINLLASGHFIIKLEQIPSEFVAGKIYHIQDREFRVSEDGLRIETANEEAKKFIEENVLHEQSIIVKRCFMVPELDASGMLVKALTPARLYRVWETTHRFWEDCKNHLSNENKVSNVETRLP